MLWKLLKYDFRAMGKQFSLIWLAALAVALINRFALPWREDSSSMSAQADSLLALITAMTFVAVLAAMFITGMIFVIQRFYKGLLGDEGYLMHTLPVATWQLVISKFLCALAVTVLNGVVAVAAVVVLMPIRWSALLDGELWQMLLLDLRANPDVLLYLGELLVLILASLALLVAMVYLSMALGHLFRHRVLMSVVAFFALDIGGTVVIDLADTLGIPLLVKGEHLALWSGTLLMCLTAAAMLAVTSLLLRQRLNLE